MDIDRMTDSLPAQPHVRIKRELKTVQKMIRLYCRDHHAPALAPCDECCELFAYAEKRLLNCPFQERKSTCSKCAIHCYKPSMKEQIVKVMRYGGPRMLLHHPILAIHHLIDEKRSVTPDNHIDSQQADRKEA
jgi:hypothetical protein